MKPERLYNVLRTPHVTEKVMSLGDKSNQYAFVVDPTATKAEIKEAVESIYNVVVERVTTVNVRGKAVRQIVRRIPAGQRVSWKKAYVRLKEGERIDFTAGVN